jgi:acyl dehydratase
MSAQKTQGKLKIGDLSGRVGEEIGVSPWLTVTQERIDLFAKAIDDPQWIHVDPVKAKQGPFGTTIAHGFLTLSLLSHLIESTFSFEERRMGINYGLNKVRFTAPLPSGSRIRARFVLAKYETLPGNGVQNTWAVTVEREGGDKPVLVAEWLGRSYS